MSEEEPPEPSAASQRTLDDGFRLLGLEAGETVHAFEPEFMLDDVKEAMFGHTCEELRELTFRMDDETSPTRLVITSAVLMHQERPWNLVDGIVGTGKEEPTWKFEGHLWEPQGSDAVKARLVWAPGSMFPAYFQRIPENPDPEGEIQMEEH